MTSAQFNRSQYVISVDRHRPYWVHRLIAAVVAIVAVIVLILDRHILIQIGCAMALAGAGLELFSHTPPPVTFRITPAALERYGVPATDILDTADPQVVEWLHDVTGWNRHVPDHQLVERSITLRRLD